MPSTASSAFFRKRSTRTTECLDEVDVFVDFDPEACADAEDVVVVRYDTKKKRSAVSKATYVASVLPGKLKVDTKGIAGRERSHIYSRSASVDIT